MVPTMLSVQASLCRLRAAPLARHGHPPPTTMFENAQRVASSVATWLDYETTRRPSMGSFEGAAVHTTDDFPAPRKRKARTPHRVRDLGAVVARPLMEQLEHRFVETGRLLQVLA